jgi:molybdopterin-containing oxidoreductase family iron-sulfur binding subunit
MSIDLNACIGCGACVVGCGSENNVSVVGKDEVARSREMQWIRIDRYYSSDTDKHGSLNLQEIPSSSENLEVSFQPIMCQHCNHAPCETVCPVAATTHSNDGLNQMAYNRCVGTKFCQNNCPYKVRRFNWFSYQNDSKFANVNPAQDDMGRMVLNPDVVVRSRGVMEKCSMCIQRIQSGKLTAKKEGRKIVDGEFQTACASACPTHAITFGDKNNPESQVSKNQADPRSYFLLEELDVQPTVNYMTKVRNKDIG